MHLTRGPSPPLNASAAATLKKCGNHGVGRPRHPAAVTLVQAQVDAAEIRGARRAPCAYTMAMVCLGAHEKAPVLAFEW